MSPRRFTVNSFGLSELRVQRRRYNLVKQRVRRSSVDKSGSKKMNHCNLQQNAFMSPHDESRGSIVPVSSVFCPKPRRVISILSNNVIHPCRSHSSQPGAAGVCDSKAGAELLDILRRKEETLSGAASSPPFFLGSPPSRASNPLAQDARFGDEKLNLVSPSLSTFLTSPSPSPSRVRGGGCGGRVKFGLKPAAVRVEGFNCLNRDRQSSNISAIA
ncbi:hypothetical protein F2Q69_00039294 [Brassica cretica]|uniref:Uncharacterized protein n=1 Tax=Brassica cretica TaxID=69181 RepID=A0A8S9SH55_BRACR|nr:hypothetical protein F2Q69_00039294 [Brassica cretica]